MNKMDIYAIKITAEKMILCIGSKENISKLKKFNHKYNVSNVVTFLIENNIYCNVDYIDDCILTNEDLQRLNDNGLLVDCDLAIEAMILKNPKKTYDNLEFLKTNKEEIDYIFENSWWLDKFDFD